MEPADLRVLDQVVQQPLMSPEQLAVLLASHPNVVRKHLKSLLQEGMVERINPRSPEISPRALFYPTDSGTCAVDKSPETIPLTNDTVARLWLVIERAYSVRNLLLTMLRPFGVREWDVEVSVPWMRRGKPRRLVLHGMGVAHLSNRQIPFAVEYDTGILAYEPERMALWVEHQRTLRLESFYSRTPLPVLVVVAGDANNLVGYLNRLQAVSSARQAPFPETFLTTRHLLYRRGVTSPIWYSSETGRAGNLFAPLTTAPCVTTAATQFWRLELRVTASPDVSLTTARIQPGRPSLETLIALKRELSPQAKRLLHQVANFPLLSQGEAEELLGDYSGQVGRLLRELVSWSLVIAYEKEPSLRFVPSQRGVALLAAEAGFGEAVRRYVHHRGWLDRFRRLVGHWDHTVAENHIALALIRAARETGGDLKWRSEPESRLYYAAQGRHWSFLPDGAGLYTRGAGRIQFALEVERSRTSRAKLERKFTQYFLYVETALYRRMQSEEFRLLLLTTSWERAHLIRSLVTTLAGRLLAPVLPVWITTLGLFQAVGPARSIWRTAVTWTPSSCFEPTHRL